MSGAARKRRAVPWVVVAVATVLDVGIRFATGFDMSRVLLAEAALFPAVALLLAWLRRRAPAGAAADRIEWVLAWTFALAGIRSGILAVGGPYLTANLVPLAVAGLLVLRSAARRRRRGPPEKEP